MNFFSILARMVSKNFLFLLLAAGVLVVLALLPERSGLRSSKKAKRPLTAGEKVKNAALQITAGASDIIKEARRTRERSSGRSCGAEEKKGHRIAVTAAKKVLTLKEKAQAEFKSIIEEAKSRRSMR